LKQTTVHGLFSCMSAICSLCSSHAFVIQCSRQHAMWRCVLCVVGKVQWRFTKWNS